MGEIADMMLDGTMCQGCGEWLNDGSDGDGFPGFCASCQGDQPGDTLTKRERRHDTRPRNTPCPECSKRFRSKHALKMHFDAKHSATKEA